MRSSSFASRTMARVDTWFRPWWRLPAALRLYVAAPPVLALAAAGAAVATTHWRGLDAGKFGLILGCGLILAISTPRDAYRSGVVRDFLTVWLLPAAIFLPPVYAALMPIPLMMVIQLLVHRGVFYRRVFTCATLSLGYVTGAVIFRAFPASFAGPSIGSGLHAMTWAIAVIICEIVGGRGNHFMIVGAIKLSDPSARMADIEWNRESLTADFAEFDLAVLITLVLAVSPLLAVFAVPTVLLVRRFMMHAYLVAQARTDAKTGLLNVTTWEREAEAELSRAVRTRSPAALALVDIDHFKSVNDTYGHLVGDKVLRAVADALTSHLRTYDRAGRFGGEEFVLMLAQTGETDARGIAERLRRHIASMRVPVDDSPGTEYVRLTISIGVAAMEGGTSRELSDLLAAADSALYRAKQTGRDRVEVAHPAREVVGLKVGLDGQLGIVQADPTGASLCPAISL
jgi:diguanylate cyclase (GGDEF)-like protein